MTIGVYDGVHLGHRTVLADLERQAGRLGVDQRAVLTFDRHPLSVVDPARAPKMLGTIEHRLEILESLGVDVVGVLPFEEVRQMHPVEFIRQVLVGVLGARLVVVGTNFRFGLDRSGDLETLRREGALHGFEIDAVELLRGEGTPVSSSAIRAMLATGNVEAARVALDRPFEIRGTVVGGNGRGRDLGFPTANVSFGADLAVPARGVYAATVVIGGAPHAAVANVGVRPTFGGDDLTVETHLLEFEGDLYGEVIAIRFERRLRDERRFERAGELVLQIARDVEAARRALDDGRLVD